MKKTCTLRMDCETHIAWIPTLLNGIHMSSAIVSKIMTFFVDIVRIILQLTLKG